MMNVDLPIDQPTPVKLLDRRILQDWISENSTIREAAGSK